MHSNQDEHPILSVGIPTYNGAAVLGATLERIVKQLEPGVEIVVSDNASTDATAEIVQRYQAQYPCIRYHRNQTNVGFDGNVDNVVRRAQGRFVWLFADDDIMHPGGIRKAVAVARQHPDVCTIFIDGLKPYTDLSADRLCRTADEFLDKTAFRSGGLSSNIVNKAVWEKLDLSDLMGLNWIHFAFLIRALPGHPSLVCSESYKSENEDGRPKRWGEDGSFIHYGLHAVRVFRAMDPRFFQRKTRRRAIETIKGDYYFQIPRAKALGLRVDYPLIRQFVGLYYDFPSFWLRDLPLLLVPRPVYRLMYRLYKKRGAAIAHG